MRTAKQRVVTGSVLNTTGTSAGDEWICQNTGTGAYAVSFKEGLRLLGGTANPMVGSGGSLAQVSVQGGRLVVNLYTTAAALANGTFQFVATVAA